MMGSDRNDADARSPRRRTSLRRRVSLSCEVIAHPHRPNLPEVYVMVGVVVENQLLPPLELSLEDLHVEVVLLDLLLAGALGLGFIALLVHQHADLVRRALERPCLKPVALVRDLDASSLELLPGDEDCLAEAALQLVLESTRGRTSTFPMRRNPVASERTGCSPFPLGVLPLTITGPASSEDCPSGGKNTRSF
jgi:hypothetical protein